jgi:hypothetical protein
MLSQPKPTQSKPTQTIPSHWPEKIENTQSFRRGKFSSCMGNLKAYISQLVNNSKLKKF